MIDATVVERYVRDANPIPHVDDLDADELAHAVAVTHARREAAMQTPTQTPTRPAPAVIPPQRGRAWAFAWAIVVVLAGIGVIALVLRDGGGTVTDDSLPPSTTTAPEIPPEGVQPRPLTEGWHLITQDYAIGASDRRRTDISALPGGGFYLTATWGLAWWSPDGLVWFEGPPAGLSYDQLGQVPRPAAIAGARAVFAGADEHSIWVGEPQTGQAEYISLDTTGMTDHVILAVAASPDTALVVGRGDIDDGYQDVVWLVDLSDGTSKRHALPGQPMSDLEEGSDEIPVLTASINENWVIVRFDPYFDVLHSANGADWQTVVLPGDVGPTEDGFWWLDVAVGGDGLVLSGEVDSDSDSRQSALWFSSDGSEWHITRRVDALQVPVTYSDALGFIAFADDRHSLRSANGEDWQVEGIAPWVSQIDGTVIAASGDTLLSHSGALSTSGGLWRWTTDPVPPSGYRDPVPPDDGNPALDPVRPQRPLRLRMELPDTTQLLRLEDCEWWGCNPSSSISRAFSIGGFGALGDYEDGVWHWVAESPFHIRHGFVNESSTPLSGEFDVVVYVTAPSEAFDLTVYDPASPVYQWDNTYEFSPDYKVRGTSDKCGPGFWNQAQPQACEWFVHEFPEGLPPGTYDIWVKWEAPCWAWQDLGLVESCADSNQVTSEFAAVTDNLDFLSASRWSGLYSSLQPPPVPGE